MKTGSISKQTKICKDNMAIEKQRIQQQFSGNLDLYILQPNKISMVKGLVSLRILYKATQKLASNLDKTQLDTLPASSINYLPRTA